MLNYSDSKSYCILFQNGQAAYINERLDRSFYLNDLIYHPKYQELAIFNVREQQLKSTLKQILARHDKFLPIDSMQFKKLDHLTIISTVVKNYLFLFQVSLEGTEVELFFVFEFDNESSLEMVKLRRDVENRKLWILAVLNDTNKRVITP